MAKSTKKSVKKSVKSVKTTKNQPTKSPKKPAKAAKASKASQPAKKSKPATQPKQTFNYKRAEGDPFRQHSSYSVVFSLLHQAGADGITRQKLIADLSRITSKDERHAGYDAAVLLSAKQNGERHQSCRSGFWIERNNDHLKLHLLNPAPKTAGK